MPVCRSAPPAELYTKCPTPAALAASATALPWRTSAASDSGSYASACTLNTPWTPVMARCRDASSSMSPWTSTAPRFCSAWASGLSGLRTRARTSRPRESNSLAAAPPWLPVPPMTRMHFASVMEISSLWTPTLPVADWTGLTLRLQVRLRSRARLCTHAARDPRRAGLGTRERTQDAAPDPFVTVESGDLRHIAALSQGPGGRLLHGRHDAAPTRSAACDPGARTKRWNPVST